MPSDEYDWMFDFVLQFLESDLFDAAVMDFVDEKCFVFDDDEEYKFVYTDIHKEFCEHVEALITSNLSELGITAEMFLESCEKARASRDINTTVFERLVAMDDFPTFRKIMTKRNTELQLESIQAFQMATPSAKKKEVKVSGEDSKSDEKRSDGDGAEEDEFGDGSRFANTLPDPEELRQRYDDYARESAEDSTEGLEEGELQDLLFQSLMEMELIHRQQELEHAELERALSLSLAAEEERLRLLMAEAKSLEGGDSPVVDRKQEKASPTPSSSSAAAAAAAAATTISAANSTAAARDAKPSAAPTLSSSGGGGTVAAVEKQKSVSRSSPGISSASPLPDLGDAKPGKGLFLRAAAKPLPSIGFKGSEMDSPGAASFEEKRRQTEDAIRKSQQQLAEQRKQEEALREKISGMVDAEEAARRAAHMKEQRDRIIAKKKMERERKVQQEAERKAKVSSEEDEAVMQESIQRIRADMAAPSSSSSSAQDGKSSEEEVAEMRRHTMRTALARRMKMELLESEEARVAAAQEEQFSELDKRLQQVEQLREDNRKREYIMSKQLERQQAQIARNIKLSAQNLN